MNNFFKSLVLYVLPTHVPVLISSRIGLRLVLMTHAAVGVLVCLASFFVDWLALAAPVDDAAALMQWHFRTSAAAWLVFAPVRSAAAAVAGARDSLAAARLVGLLSSLAFLLTLVERVWPVDNDAFSAGPAPAAVWFVFAAFLALVLAFALIGDSLDERNANAINANASTIQTVHVDRRGARPASDAVEFRRLNALHVAFFVLFVSVAIFAPRFYWDLTHHATPTRALDFQQGGVGAIQLGMLVSSWLAHDSDSHAVLTQHWFALTITFFVAGIVQIHAHAVGVPVKILHWVAPIGIPIDVIVLLGVRPPAPLLKED